MPDNLTVARRSAPSVLDQRSYCIMLVACETAQLRPGAGVENEPDAHLLTDTKMAFTVASLLFGVGQTCKPQPPPILWDIYVFVGAEEAGQVTLVACRQNTIMIAHRCSKWLKFLSATLKTM